ncbi:alpha/beta hydrolase [Solimonas fluminis]|uniref:Alpha/beta hydrolase n=2 Tax=Solimonas fluminis TaxID=2086571 RepID=A0A2S5TC36_9GAMM|nr:alpha/beta hydrolase [Solimonas fluminis]
MQSVDSPFHSQGTRCAGTLLLPPRAKRPPVIVMAHGFGAIRAAGLYAFAERFVKAGYAVFLFDYRGFGDSEGEPRHWVSPRRHLQDWKAALVHVRKLPQVDASRLVLWGSSFSGGHVLQTAAEDGSVAAVIAQVPHVSGLASVSKVPLASLVKLSVAALRDVAGSLVGRPHYSRIVGKPGELAAMSSAESWDGYMALFPEGARWENKVLSRIFLELPLYSPGRFASRVKAPTLVVAGRQDSVTPPKAAQRAAARLPQGEFELLDSNHFQPYVDAMFEKNIGLQLSFLQRKVPVGA